MECNNYNLINNEIITFYKDDKLMVIDLVHKLNDNIFLILNKNKHIDEISDITGLLKEEILKLKNNN